MANEDFTPPLVVLAAHVERRAGDRQVSGGVVLGDLFRCGNEFVERLRRIGCVKARFGEELLVVEERQRTNRRRQAVIIVAALHGADDREEFAFDLVMREGVGRQWLQMPPAANLSSQP